MMSKTKEIFEGGNWTMLKGFKNAVDVDFTVSKNRANIQKAKVEFQAGNLYFNRKSTAAVVLQHPFGGFNMSGTDAKTGTADYLTNFLNLKSVTEDLTD